MQRGSIRSDVWGGKARALGAIGSPQPEALFARCERQDGAPDNGRHPSEARRVSINYDLRQQLPRPAQIMASFQLPWVRGGASGRRRRLWPEHEKERGMKRAEVARLDDSSTAFEEVSGGNLLGLPMEGNQLRR